MLTHPIITQLTTLKLHGMAEALSEQYQDPAVTQLGFDDRLSLLVDREQNLQSNRLLASRLRQAKLHLPKATLADMNYQADRQLNKTQITQLATGNWLRQHDNLILVGATGTGKTYLACALAHKACLLGYRARYFKTSRLVEELDLGRADGRYLALVKAIAKVELLILDDWGMVKLQGQHQQFILDILDDRYQKHSTLVTSQLPAANWYEQIKNSTFADAILDRLLGQAQIIQLSGPSLRKKCIKTEGGVGAI